MRMSTRSSAGVSGGVLGVVRGDAGGMVHRQGAQHLGHLHRPLLVQLGGRLRGHRHVRDALQ
jgi:hypothetical protein